MTLSARRWGISLFVLLWSVHSFSAVDAMEGPESVPRAWAVSPNGAEMWEAEIAELHGRLDAIQRQQASYKGYPPAKVDRAEDPCPRWVASAEYLNWQVRRSDLDFAMASDASALALGVGNVERLEFDRDSGARIWLGYRTAARWEIGFGYTYFQSSATASAVEPAAGNLWATRSYPDSNAEAATAAAFGSFDYHVFDMESRHAFRVTDSASLKMFGGMRWARIEQDLRLGYDGRDFDNALVQLPLSMDAYGVRVGIDGYWHMWRGWSSFGRGAVSVMYGQFQTRLLETNVSGGDTIVDVTNDYSQAVSVLEAAVGMSWRYGERLEIATGYEITSWFNVGNRSLFVNSMHEGLYNHEITDLLLDGIFFRFTVWL